MTKGLLRDIHWNQEQIKINKNDAIAKIRIMIQVILYGT